MKVLVVLDSFYPNVDGPIEVVVSIAKTFAKNNLGTVELLVPKYPQKIEVEGVTVHRCVSVPASGGYRGALPAFDKKIKKLIKNGGFDVIHLHSPFTLAKYAQKLGKKLGIPVIFTMHTKFKDELARRLKSKMLVSFVMNYIMKCINGCDCVTTVSRGTVDTLESYGYKKCGKVKVIYNATSMLPLAADEEEVKSLKEQYRPDGGLAFMYAGRLVAVKNIQFSLNALAKVKERGYNNFKFVIVGDGEYGKTLHKLAQSLGIEENVAFTGRIIDKKLLACYFAACDVMLFPSVFDNASIAILEAAANALPVATYKGSCSAERIEDGVSGFAWDNDEDVWAENIIGLLNNPERVENAGRGALERVYASWDEITEEYYNLYNSAIADKKQSK